MQHAWHDGCIGYSREHALARGSAMVMSDTRSAPVEGSFKAPVIETKKIDAAERHPLSFVLALALGLALWAVIGGAIVLLVDRFQ